MTDMTETVSQEQVSHMFNAISKKYDLTNRLISLGIDRGWRRKLKQHIIGSDLVLLDCATGTCDQLLSLMDLGTIQQAVGIDLAEEMLAIGKQKVEISPHADQVDLVVGNALSMPLEDGRFDYVTMTFGIRNVQGDCLPEIARVLKPRGKALILEFSLPKNRLIRMFHLTYLRHILPLIGGWVSGNGEAYRYLNKTIETFPYGEAFLDRMKQAGFEQLKAIPLSFGIATLYTGVKP